MSTKELIESAVDHLHTSAGVKTVYGEPVVIDGRTIIPVARVAYGFGGGTGTKAAEEGADVEAGAKGEGVGGGMSAKPVGIVEIGPEETKFVPIGNVKRIAITALIGSAIGLIAGLVLGGRAARR